jgi:hypothetical protein
MSESIHVLVVRAAGLSWALPMGRVEQTFAFRDRRVHNLAGAEVVVFRGDALQVVRIAAPLGFAGDGPLVAGVVVWAGARRRVVDVDELVGQLVLERQDVPSAAHGGHTSGVVVLGSGEVVPVLEPEVIAGAWSPAGAGAFGSASCAKRTPRDREHRLRERCHRALPAARKAGRDRVRRGAARDSSFAFLFVPRFGAVSSLLDHLGVGSPKAA